MEGPLLHSDVDCLVPSVPPLHQQQCSSVGERSGLFGNSQLFKIHPPAFEYLILTGMDIKGEWLQTTDEVEIREVVVVSQSMLLTEC